MEDFNLSTNSQVYGTKAILKGFIGMEITLAGLIALFGIAGNVLTILVLRGQNLRHTSTAFYFTALASIDIMVLLIGPTAKAVSAAVFESDRHARDMSIAACKLILYVNYSSSQISAWVLVAVTIDRAIWVLLPFSARQFCTVRRAALVLTLIASLVCGINIQVLLNANLIPRRSENITVCHLHDPITRHAYVSYIDPGLVTVGPFLIMLAANLLIIRKLRQIRARREATLNKKRRSDAGGNLTKMLLCTNFFYLVSSLPYLLLMLLLKEKRSEILQHPLLLNIVYVTQVMCYSLFNLNYAIHFLLYCLAGPAFKAEAFRLLGIRQGGSCGGGGTSRGGGVSRASRTVAGGGGVCDATCDAADDNNHNNCCDTTTIVSRQPEQQQEEMELLPVKAQVVMAESLDGGSE